GLTPHEFVVPARQRATLVRSVKPLGKWAPMQPCSKMPQPSWPSNVARARWSQSENCARPLTAGSLWSYTAPSTQPSPFHTPCDQSGSPPYPQPTFNGMPTIGSISSVDVLPSRVVRSIDARNG